MTTMTLPRTASFRGFAAWLKRLSKQRRIGLLRTSDGDDFVVMDPARIAELESILSDPVFLKALEAGVADVKRGRLKRVARGLTLRDVADKSVPCNEAMATAVERGVKDVRAGKLSALRSGQSLADLL